MAGCSDFPHSDDKTSGNVCSLPKKVKIVQHITRYLKALEVPADRFFFFKVWGQPGEPFPPAVSNYAKLS